jgi:protein-tyrosine phosphatase
VKPVFVSDELGCLYQAGARKLDLMPSEQRDAIARALSLVLAVSPQVPSDFKAPVVHMPFGDNKQWRGPDTELAGMIQVAARMLAEGKHVMASCYYGVNRSGLIATLIVRQYAGVSGAEALSLVRRSRKGSVGGNPHFVSYLEGLGAP